MYLYKIEIMFWYKYVASNSEYREYGNREFQVIGKDVEDVIQKTKEYIWKTIDGIEKPEDVIILETKILYVKQLTYVSF